MNHAHSWSEEGPKQGQHSVLPLLTPGIEFLCDFFPLKPRVAAFEMYTLVWKPALPTPWLRALGVQGMASGDCS